MATLIETATAQFTDWRWRLNNLYKIVDEQGNAVPFRMNWAQENLFDNMHYNNIILKARQLGFSTFVQLFMLDCCIFKSNIRAGVIAHTRDDAENMFRDKVKYPYDNLPEGIKEANPALLDSARTLSFTNNSELRVGTSLRSGTLNYLHISEYGKICARFPDKAKEIRTGALNTVHAGNVIFVESTAEGQEGAFFEMCEAAQEKQRRGDRLTELDFKFHFYPWWQHPEYRLDPEGVVIDDEQAKYFAELKNDSGVTLTDGQKAWYVKKHETQLEEMKREYPSTPAEAFEASIEGAYYARQLERMDKENRFTHVPHDPAAPVHTGWDLGYGDLNCIWFFQQIGPRLQFIDYLEDSGLGIEDYLREIDKRCEANDWTRGTDYYPHDITAGEVGIGRTRIETVRKLGKRNYKIVPRVQRLEDGIQATRIMFPRMWFDRTKCALGVRRLRHYRKKWDETKGCWSDRELHDDNSHGAAALRTVACGVREDYGEPEPTRWEPSIDEMIAEHVGGLKGAPSWETRSIRG